MSTLYLTENGAKVSFGDNCIKILVSDKELEQAIPIETVESVSVIGKPQLTTQCIEECMKRGISISYFSQNNGYYGRIETTNYSKVTLQCQQAKLYDTNFSIELARQTLSAKLKNQQVILRRLARNRDCNVEDEVEMLNDYIYEISTAENVSQIMGYEGVAAKHYFQALSKLIDDTFKFYGRSKRPPKDEFNAMLSFGYSCLFKEIYGKICDRGLNPYFGFVHRDRNAHATLVSDMIEEWRPVIIDSLVMSMINGHEISKGHFQKSGQAVYLTQEGMKRFLRKYETKILTKSSYMEYIDYPITFRRAIELQMNMLSLAITQEDASLYRPIRIH